MDAGGSCISCPDDCSDSIGNNYCSSKLVASPNSKIDSTSYFSSAGPDGTCVGRCGVYTENSGPVPILSGVGLDVEDDDHNEVFMMQVKLNLFLQ